MNNQINIMYFLEQLCDVTVEDKEFRGYLNMLRRDISKIVDLAAPHTLAGQLNIRDVKKVEFINRLLWVDANSLGPYLA